MKVVVLYRPNSEHGTTVETFIHDFQIIHDGEKLQIVNVDAREGIALASLYDIMQYPAILALADNGSLVRGWEGENLPLIDEVAYYSEQ